MELHQIVRAARLHRAFLRDIEPLVRVKANAYAIVLPTVMFYDDGRIVTEFKLPPDLQAVVDRADEMIAEIARSYEAMR